MRLAVGCGGSDASPGEEVGQGGSSSTDGQPQTSVGQGGLLASGGQSATGMGLGGAITTGGAASSGSATGGIAASQGGSAATGGTSSSPGTVGGTNKGGASSTGGSKSVGGSSTSGGDSSLGGASKGGASSTGGSKSATTGGATSVGGSGTVGSATGGNATGGSTTGGRATGGSGTGGSATGGNTGAIIRNDVFWEDTSGNFIYSQGGGVLQVGDTYYWYGVKYGGAVTYAANPTSKNDDISFAGVTIYSSKDLANWKLENTVKVSNAGGWFGRIGVVYHAGTKKYVLVGQGGAGEYFATSDTPTGNFVYNNSVGTLSGIANGGTGDQTTFQDDDGKAYVICSSKSGRSNLYVVPLRESDYLALGTPTRIFNGAGREGNAMFKYNGRYYFCSSDLHGWNSSHTYCISATNILGPYGAEFVMTNTDPDYSHVTQTGFFVTVKGSAGSFVIFAGDRWSDFAGNGLGYNQWMPITFEGTNPIFHSLSEWSIDAAAGTWSVGANNNYALNPSFEADRVTVTTPVGWTTTNGSNSTGARHTGRWGWQISSGGSLDQKVVNLPNGMYKLSVWVKGAASGAQLYAKGFGETAMSASLGSGSSWTNVTLPGIAVTNGTCQIGVTGGAQVDDFMFVKNTQ